MSVGSPGALLLDVWGDQVALALGGPTDRCYLVGSGTERKNPRDVDVVLILDDDRFEAEFGIARPPFSSNRRWAAMCTAFSLWGQLVTGMPIDFKIQPQTWANEKHGGKPRHALGLYPDGVQAP